MSKSDDLRTVDLNLLKALDALLSEGSVTRAAHRLGIGQSAMSAALARLRRLMSDELLTRTTGGMRLTPQAMAMAEPLRALLDDARALVAAPAAFDPATARRTFRIALPDGVEFRLMPKLLALLRREAPGIDLVTRPFDGQTYQADLDADRLDLAIGFVMTGQDHLRHRCLFRSGYVALFNPELTGLEAPITLDDYTGLPHAVTSYGSDAVGAVDEALAASGATRTIVMRTTRFLMLPALVRAAPVLATVERSLAADVSDLYGLAVSPLPITVPTFSVNMVWHSSYTRDAGHAWLRRTLQAQVAESSAAAD